MAMNRPNNDGVDLEYLRQIANLRLDDAYAIREREGMDGIRVRAAVVFYQTDPSMDTADAAQAVGLGNRGLLVQYVLDHHIRPAEDTPDVTKRDLEELYQGMKERLARWRS